MQAVGKRLDEPAPPSDELEITLVIDDRPMPTPVTNLSDIPSKARVQVGWRPRILLTLARVVMRCSGPDGVSSQVSRASQDPEIEGAFDSPGSRHVSSVGSPRGR